MTSLRGDVALTRRPATSADTPFLRTLFADAHLELAVLPTDSRFVLVDMQFRAQRRQHSAKHPGATHEILVADGSDVGRLVVDHSTDPIRIVDISVALGHRREGIAGAVFADLVDQADAEHRTVELTVWSGNTAAVSLVEGAGFAARADEAGYVTYARTPKRAGA